VCADMANNATEPLSSASRLSRSSLLEG
jgi:hypothetical protein